MTSGKIQRYLMNSGIFHFIKASAANVNTKNSAADAGQGHMRQQETIWQRNLCVPINRLFNIIFFAFTLRPEP